ncbi:heme lyase NrfEFG subunit NrfF [Actinobacillus pleuropneumoniae]|uniref:Formate-dependent nitrite reductase complex subunit n=2 Tax=Actinobacillus pleuropneumoniae TaxID=715 RepID=B3H1T1_ACTP7|nr:heme lyase NrfEFG subunit NrfF [Actinobacillus pleuropneumoniae]ACE61758.1 Cytochrome c-type biogenesis protein ccmH precursor [Actinobacillus pleuropneumoniae serovar 7 str. AP76]EFN02709.1 Possible formate-dependent nitrite reductase protein NrfF [Actinobacillus pleuropneumoniae serovar 13 str. N273]UKH39206.1 heme lyase NrfEFG subunit NrfF [Actinobacillus pleuropneumoniae]UQZ24817.1 heme lyase NrfEFG subunit NrfF [Actinobacillus pleuropneumoniae]
MTKLLQKIAFILPLVFSLVAKAEMVDTFQFQNETDRVRAVALAKSLRCPQCQNQNLVESNATMAYKLRLEVYEMVNQGKTDEEIIKIMTERFGHFVNYKPPFNAQTWLLWGMPVGLFLILFGAIVWRTKNVNSNVNKDENKTTT